MELGGYFLFTLSSIKDHHSIRMRAQNQKRKESRKGVLDLFRTPNMRLKTVLLTFCW